MSLVLYPAIDIRAGQCVRLSQGDYGQETVYEKDPLEAVEKFVSAGAEWIHVVDLDGARSGDLINLQVIEQIAKEAEIPIQVGGGVRSMDRLERLLSRGISRVIIGSAAIDHPEFVQQALEKYGEQIVIGIDVRDGKVATHGWLETSTVSAEDCARSMVELGAERFIFTDISRDGMLSGVNLEAVYTLAQSCGKPVIASGGVRSLEDIRQIATYHSEGIDGVIIGKALYSGAFDLAQALAIARNKAVAE